MTHNNFIYIAVMALVSYAIRVLPLTLIRKPIKNQFIQSFLYYVPSMRWLSSNLCPFVTSLRVTPGKRAKVA